jgi:cell division protein FtsB
VRIGSLRAGAEASRARLTPRGAILAVVVTALVLYLAIPLRAYVDQREAIATLERQTEAIEQRNADLRVRIQQLNDPVYLERLARECLGMVKRGEIAFIVVPENGRAQPPVC